MMSIKVVLLLCFINFLIKKNSDSGANNEIKQNQQLAENYTNQLLKKKTNKKEEFILHVKTIFGVLI